MKFSMSLEELGMETITFDPGFNIDINFDVLKNAGNVWFEELIQVLNGLTIPDVTFDNGNYMKDNHFYIEQLVDNVTLAPDVANNAVTLTCNKLTAKFTCGKFRYKIAPLIVAKGDVEVDMKKVKIGFGL
jgi:hypothetical protein